jgi:hypothetical protein
VEGIGRTDVLAKMTWFPKAAKASARESANTSFVRSTGRKTPDLSSRLMSALSVVPRPMSYRGVSRCAAAEIGAGVGARACDLPALLQRT